MRKKLMLLSGSQMAAQLSYYIQQILTDIAVTFGHSFLIIENKISELSIKEYGSSITEEAIVAGADCDALFSIADDEEGLKELSAGLGCILCGHLYTLPDCLSEYSLLKSEEMPAGLISYPMTLDKAAFALAANHLYKRAKAENSTVNEIPYQGSHLVSWEEVTDKVANKYYIMNPNRTDASACLSQLLRFPESMGVVLATKKACEILNEGAKSICGLPSFLFDVYWDDKGAKLFYVRTEQTDSAENVSPFGLLYAAVDMLKYSLQLEREAACLPACINNVLEAGWRTADIARKGQLHVTTEAIFNLISEQIELVGEFIRH